MNVKKRYMNKKNYLFLIILFSIKALSGLGQNVNYPFRLDFSGTEGEMERINLSSIAEDVKYVQLETIDEAFISEIGKLILTSNHLIIADRTNMATERLLVFNLNGKFITLIQKVGRGPGEYVSISDFDYDPINKCITVLDSYQKKVIQYSIDGLFIREVLLDFSPYNLAFIQQNNYIFSSPLQLVNPDSNGNLKNLTVCNLDFKTIKKIASPGKPSFYNPKLLRLLRLYTYDNNLRFKQPFENRIYGLDKNLNLHLISEIDFGRKNIPESLYRDNSKFQKNIENFKSLQSVVETKKYLFIKYRYRRITYTAFCSKEEGTISYLSSQKGSNGFINDFDGSHDIWPTLSTSPRELICCYNSIDFIDYCDKYKSTKYTSKFPDHHKRLLELLGQINEQSNPIIQIITLKE